MALENSEAPNVRTGAERLKAFSDGVFAIAITLLVLEVKIPNPAEAAEMHGADDLIRYLVGLGPSYFGFVLSFIIIGIMWMNHHNIFRLMRYTDQGLLILNTFLMMFVAFVPFPTALLGDFLTDPDPGKQKVAAVVYTGIFTLTAVVYNLLWRYMRDHTHLHEPFVTPDMLRRINRSFLAGPPLYFLSFVLAFVNAWLSMAIIVVLALVYFVPDLIQDLRSHHHRSGGTEPR